MANIAIVEAERMTAEPGLIGKCQLCNGKMIPKCGNVKVWHWSHEANDHNCTYKPMTQWHYDWQNRFDIELREIRTLNNTISDILRKDNAVGIEFQNSPFDFNYVQKKEKSTPTVLWVVNIKEQYERGQISFENKTIVYMQPKEILYSIGNLFIDFESGKLCKIKGVKRDYNNNAKYNGLLFIFEYEVITYEQFIEYFLTTKF